MNMKLLPFLFLVFSFGNQKVAIAAEVRAQKPELSAQEKQERVMRLSVDELISELEQKPGALGIIHRLRRRGDKKAMPALKAAFEKVSRKVEKQAIAAALVSLGDEGQFLDFLVSYASAAVYSGMPVPMILGDDGRPVTKGLNPAFVEWCKAKGVEPSETARNSVYETPSDVMFLGLAGTKKAIPLFMDGLKSENDQIAKRSAQGLASLKHSAGAKAILKATEKRHGERAALLADTLIYFDDEESKKGFEKYVQNVEIKKAMRKRIQEKRNQNVWGED